MRRLAERCGVKAPTIYHYFGDKHGLIDALLEERFAEIVEHLRSVPEAEDPLVTVGRLGREFIAFVRRNPTQYRLLTLPRSDALPTPPSAEKAIALVQRPLHQLQAQGRLAAPDVETAHQAIWATLHGVLHLRIVRPGYPWADDVEQIALDAVTRGLVRQEGTA